MNTTKSLRMTFLNDKGKKKNLLLAGAAENLYAEAVKAAMSKIRDANVIGDGEGDFYKTIDSAAYIERTVHSLFGSDETRAGDAGAGEEGN